MKSCFILGMLAVLLSGSPALSAEGETDEKALPLFKAAMLSLKEGKDDEALATLENCLKYKLSADREAIVHACLGNLYRKTDHEKAFEHLKKAQELDATNFEVLPQLGSEYARRKDYAKARECWSTYLKEKPDGANATPVKEMLEHLEKAEKESDLIDKFNQAIRLYNTKKYAEAVAILEETRKVQHDHSKDEQEILGLCYLNMGKNQEAIEIFTNLLSTNPKQPKIVSALASAYEASGDLKQARACLKKYLQMEHGSEMAQVAKDRMPTLKKLIKTAGSADASDYFDSVSKPCVMRWSMTRMPLRVYFEPSTEVRNYQQSYDSAIPRALDLWCKATNGRLSWKVVNEKRNADIEVVYTADPAAVAKSESHSEAGICESQTVRQRGAKIGGINRCVVKLLTTDDNGNPFSQEALEATAAHEIGHALGLPGHSSNPQDVMFFAATKTVKEGLTERDVNTIKYVYDAVVYEDGRVEVPGRETAESK